MRKFTSIFFAVIFIFNAFQIYATNIKIKKPIPLLYSNGKIQDIIDYAIIDVTNEIKRSKNPFIKQLLIDRIVKKVGDYLTSKGYVIPTTPPLYIPSPDSVSMKFGVPVVDFRKSHSFYSYPSWYTKPTDYEGTRMIEIIDKHFENMAIFINEASVLALPLKLLFLIEPFNLGSKHMYYLHVALVDPIMYLKNFFKPSYKLINLFENEKEKILADIKSALSSEKNVYFANLNSFYQKKVNAPSLIEIAEVKYKNIDEFVDKFLKIPDILTTLPDGRKVRYVSHDLTDPNFPYSYDPSFLNSNQTEITGILSFCRFILPTKNIWLMLMPDGHTINYVSMLMLMKKMNPEDFNPPKSPPMEFLIKNSMVHIYARYFPDNQTVERFITFKYRTKDGRKIYRLAVFDPYITTSLLTLGQWHKPFSYIDIYIYQFPNGKIGIFAKNPVFLIEKYYSDVGDQVIPFVADKWDSDPTTMFHFPRMTKIEIAEFMKNKLKKLIMKTLKEF